MLKSSIMRNSRGEEDVRYPFLTSRAAIGALVHSEGRLEVSSRMIAGRRVVLRSRSLERVDYWSSCAIAARKGASDT